MSIANSDEAMIEALAERYTIPSDIIELWRRSGGSPADMPTQAGNIRTVWRVLWREAANGKISSAPNLVREALLDYPHETRFLKFMEQETNTISKPTNQGLDELQDLIDFADNADTIRQLFEPSRRDLLTPFVGAGISVPYKMPQWTNFLKTQAAKHDCLIEIENLLSGDDYEGAAKHLEQIATPFQFRQIVESAYGDHHLEKVEIQGLPREIVKLGKRSIITTNFDRVLETSANQMNMPIVNVIEGAQPDRLGRLIQSGGRGLVKIHGSWDERNTRVLTKQEYEKVYGHDEVDFGLQIPSLLQTLFRSRTLIFIGCSLAQDRTMRVLHESVKSIDDGSIHFAILEEVEKAQNAKRLRFLSEHHIRPIWFPRKRFESINRIIAALND